jgi:hypothetical protein
MVKLNYRNLILFLLLFCIEVTIALYIKQGFIRAIFGDFLVVIMLYYFISSFIQIKRIYLAIIVLTIAYTVEFLQFIDILNIINYKKNNLVNIILGTTFNIKDLIAYTLGITAVFLIEDGLKLDFNK